VATVRQCRGALTRLAGALERIDPAVRAEHIPTRTLLCQITDLETAFTARIDPEGLHDLAQVGRDAPRSHPDIRFTVDSDELVAIANGTDNVVTAWLHGRVQVSAPVRDLLRLRSLISL
jgi:hypothetical protein